jgi:hypothetical protein
MTILAETLRETFVGPHAAALTSSALCEISCAVGLHPLVSVGRYQPSHLPEKSGIFIRADTARLRQSQRFKIVRAM